MPKTPTTMPFLASRRWTPSEARDALASLAASGLSAAAFAAREGIDVQRLRSWRRKFDAESPKRTERPLFVEVLPPAPVVVEVVLASGRVLRVPESIDTTTLLRLVVALEGSSPPC